MAHFVFVEGYLNITGTGLGDISTHAKSIQATHSQAEVDDTCMQASTNPATMHFKARLPGLQDYTMSLSLADDAAATSIDSGLWALWGTTFAVAWRYVNTTKSTSNPEYGGTFMLTNDGVGGAVGAAANRPVNLVLASGVITRLTS